MNMILFKRKFIGIGNQVHVNSFKNNSCIGRCIQKIYITCLYIKLKI